MGGGWGALREVLGDVAEVGDERRADPREELVVWGAGATRQEFAVLPALRMPWTCQVPVHRTCDSVPSLGCHL